MTSKNFGNIDHQVSVLPSELIQVHQPDIEPREQLPSHSITRTFKKEVLKRHSLVEDSGREKLKKHRGEVAGRVGIPDMWGHEELLKEWIDSSAFTASLVPAGLMSARAALMKAARLANSGEFRVENRC